MKIKPKKKYEKINKNLLFVSNVVMQSHRKALLYFHIASDFLLAFKAQHGVRSTKLVNMIQNMQVVNEI